MSEEVLHKQSKKRAFRKRHASESSNSSSAENEESMLDEFKEVQKLRKRPNGISLIGLATGKPITAVEEAINDADPFKMKTGGFIDMKTKKTKRLSSEEVVGTAFAAETNQRDEDAEMQKYVEQEILKRKGVQQQPEATKKQDDPDAVLYQIPEHLQADSAIMKTEDMLSNQMLSGIPEVDLGIAAKIRNIEKTEEAKQKLLAEQRRKKDAVSDFVPTNMAVNFVQHNRYNVDSSMLPQAAYDKSKDEHALKKFKDKVIKR